MKEVTQLCYLLSPIEKKKKKKYKLKMIKKNRYKMGKIGDILQPRCGFDTNEMR